MIVHVFSTLLLLVTASAQERSEDDVRYVGCYNDTFALNAGHHTHVKPLTWEICIHLCANMLTRYAGVQASKHLCFCGNDLEQYSEVVRNQQACSSCHENSSRECGGTATLSLYQLSETVQEAVLLAMDGHGVQIININTLTTTSIVGSPMSATAVDYHYSLQEIFFISKNKILRSSYIPLLMKYFPPITIVEAIHNLNDLAVDWVADDIFWSCAESSNINQSKLDGSKPHSRLYNAPSLREVTFDPYEKLIYPVYRSEVSVINSAKKLQEHIFQPYAFEYAKFVALDIQRQIVYVIGSYRSDGTIYLTSMDYNSTSFRVIYSGSKLSNPFDLDVLHDVVIWGNYANSQYTLYRANISPWKSLENITVIFQGSQKINKIKIYHSEAQTPTTKYACMRKACSHSCTSLSLSRVKCDCPHNMLLEADGRTCMDEPTTQTSTTINQDTTETPTLTAESTAASEEQFSLEVSSSSVNLSSEFTRLFRVKFEETLEPTETVATTKTQNSESSLKLPLVSIVSFTCDVIIISVVLILIYLVFILQKQNRQLRYNFSKPSELIELTYNDN